MIYCPMSTLPFKVNTELPVFGRNYGPGWIGFTNTKLDPVSGLIDYFERWDASGWPFVSHTFIVDGPDSCIEALAGHGGVASGLGKYLNDPRIRVYFRRPKQMTPEMALSMIAAAKSKLGLPYDRGLIVSEMLAATLFGWYVNKLFSDWPKRLVAKILGDDTDYICSELVAYVLSTQPLYDMVGILANDLDTIDPMQLFIDQKIFDPFVNDLSLKT